MFEERPAPSASSATPALAIRDLKFRYRAQSPGAWTVDIDAFTLAPGEQALLTGRSGLGKSTLLHLIAGLIDPIEGAVEVGGRDVHAMRGAVRDTYRGRHIGMVFQTFHLLSGFTAEENVLTALMFSSQPRREHALRARDLLRRLNIDRTDAMIDELSVGQQQRVAVARALACRPNLVLADEPTASLDPENGAAATELLQRACADEGAALLCVSHDPALPERFERVERLEDLHKMTGAAS